jgi:hypothetical protein
VKADPLASKTVAPTKASTSDLFGGDDDSDDDLFSSKPKPKSTPVPPVITIDPIVVDKAETMSTPLSGDILTESDNSVPKIDCDSDVEPPSSSPVVSKRMSGALAKRMTGLDASKIIMPGMAPPPRYTQNRDSSLSSESSGTRNRSSSSSESGEIVNVTLERATVCNKKGRARKAPSRKKVDIPTDLHNDSLPSASGIDSGVRKGDVVALSGKTEGQAKFSPDLKPSNPVPNTVTLASSGLFEDSGASDDLFGNKIRAIPKTVTVEKDEKTISSTKGVSSGLFGDDSDDDDLFSSKPKKPIMKTSNPVPTKKVASSGLFGDDDDDDDDLFGSSRAKSKPVSKSTSSSLFGDDDDDDLFGGKKSSGKGLFD